MKLHMSDYGDSSVGIYPAEITMEFPDTFIEDMDEAARQLFKKDAEKLFIDYFDPNGGVDSYFDDECPDCKAINRKCKEGCPNSAEGI